MTEREALKLALEALENNRQTHHYCEDTWYSCPKHEDGCANDAEGDECNCGADKANAEIDATITAIKEALMSQSDGAQPEQERYWERVARIKEEMLKVAYEENRLLKDHPPQRKPLTDEEITDAVRDADFDWHYGWTLDDEEPNRFTKFSRAIEAAHGIIAPTELKEEV